MLKSDNDFKPGQSKKNHQNTNGDSAKWRVFQSSFLLKYFIMAETTPFTSYTHLEKAHY